MGELTFTAEGVSPCSLFSPSSLEMASIPCQSASNVFDTPYLHQKQPIQWILTVPGTVLWVADLDETTFEPLRGKLHFGLNLQNSSHYIPGYPRPLWILGSLETVLLVGDMVVSPVSLAHCWHKGSRMTLNSFALNLTSELVDERPMFSIMVLFVPVWFRGGQCFN